MDENSEVEAVEEGSERVNVTLPKSIYDRIERERGRVARSAFVADELRWSFQMRDAAKTALGDHA